MEDLLVGTGLVTKACYRIFFKDFNFLDLDCVKTLISKALGYLVIAGSMGVKIPQIRSIVKAKSAAGISLSMFILELVGYSINLAYNVLRQNPFSTWGEILFLLVQTTIILALMQFYNGNLGVLTISIGVAWISSLAALLSGQVPMEIVVLLQTASVGIFTMSKVPQVITNFRNKSTGKLAFLTFFLNTAGAAARIFTTLQEVPDKLLLASAVLGFALNLIITIQIIIFGDREAKEGPKIANKPENLSAKGLAGVKDQGTDDGDSSDVSSEGSSPRGGNISPTTPTTDSPSKDKKDKSSSRKTKKKSGKGESSADDSPISSSSEALSDTSSKSKKDKKDKKEKEKKEKKKKEKK